MPKPFASAAPLSAAGVLVALLAGAPAGAQSPSWNLYDGLTAIYLPFPNGTISPGNANTPLVHLQLNGGLPVGYGMDTGSTGIVVSANYYVPAPGDVDGGPGQIVYSSSGRKLNGTYYTTDVAILSNAMTPVATARVQVLRVTSITCVPNPRDCRENPNPQDVAYMGIGFHRGSGSATGPQIPRNPFVNLTSLASGAPVETVRPGYVVTRTGVHLGISSAITENFAFVKLAPDTQASTPTSPQWNTPPLDVTAGGKTGSGTILVDTGIDYMFLTPPPGSTLATGQNAPSGTPIELYLPGRSTPQPASYHFEVDQSGDFLKPASVAVVSGDATFVNTGRMFLTGFDYLYDAVGGYVGYGWNGQVASQYGQVTPGLSLQAAVALPDGFTTSQPTHLDGGAVLMQSGRGTFAGSIGGNGGLTLGGGRVDLTGTNTYTGGTTVAPGTRLRIASDAALGEAAGVLNLAGGTLQALAGFGSARGIAVGPAGGAICACGYAVVLSGPVSGSGAMALTGGGDCPPPQGTQPGALALNGTVTLTGPILVQQGTVTVNGALSASAFNVSAQGILDGTGSITAPTFVAGALAPGNPGGVLTIDGSLYLQWGSVFRTRAAAAAQYGQLAVVGDVALNGGGLSFVPAYTPARGAQFRIIDNRGAHPVAGTFAGLPEGARFTVAGAIEVAISYVGGDGNDVVLTVTSGAAPLAAADGKAASLAGGAREPAVAATPTAIPALEPWALAGLSAGLAWLGLRRRKASARP